MDYGERALRNHWLGILAIFVGVALLLSKVWILMIVGGAIIVGDIIYSFRNMGCPYCDKWVDMRGQDYCS